MMGRHFSLRPVTVGLTQRHSGPTGPHQLTLRACLTRWCGRRGFAGGLGVTRAAGTPLGSDDGCARQGGAVGFSPETADGDGTEKTTRRGSVPRRQRSSGDRGGHRRVLQLEERTGEVRRGAKGQTTGVRWSSPRGGDDDAVECSAARS
jgi:hypothetical protein